MTRLDAAQPTTASRLRRLTAVALPAAVAGWITVGGTPLAVTAGSPAHTRPPVRSSTPSPLAVHPNVAVAPSQSYTVNSTADAPDDTPGDGHCSAAGACTLRAAVDEANADSGLTSIAVPAGTYTLTLGELQITASSGMVITGAGNGTVVSGHNASRVFQVSVTSGSLVALHSLAITAGLAPPGGGTPEDGGAVLIDANSSAELDSVDVGSSSTTINAGSSSGSGGGIADDGQLWLLNSRVHDNVANATGGGIYVDGVGVAQIESDTVDHNTADENGGFAGGGGVDNLGTATVTGSTLSDNTAPDGGGFSNRGNGSIASSTLSGNHATAGAGGGGGAGVDNEATLSMVTSRVTGNHASNDGGGIYHFGSSLNVNRSTIDSNTADNDGGGVASESPGVTLTNDTVSANVAHGSGAGLVVQYPTTLRSTTVAGNGAGTGIADLAGNPELDVQDTVVAANTGGNCTGPLQVRSLGHNLDSDGTCTLSGSGDISNRDARLGPLASNGGPTPTMALLMNSPAINAGDSQCPGVDERGVGRPQGAGCDMGAFELAPYYWTVASDGGVFSFGGAPFFGSEGGTRLNKPIVGMAATPDGLGYWLVAADGGVFAFGDAGYFGGRGGQPLNQPVVGMAATPSGHGYWLVARDGGIFSYGDANYYGSTGAMHLNAPVVGMAADPGGAGYWLVASDGGIFTFGTPAFMATGFHGSEGNKHLNQPVVGMAATPDGGGYWMVASDGGIFSFGSAGFFGSMGAVHLNKPVVGMAAAPDGQGYWMVASDGGIFTFGHAPFFGSTGDLTLNAPMVGMAGV